MPKVIVFTSLHPELSQQLVSGAPSDFQVSIHAADLPVAEKIALAQDADFLILFPGHLEEAVVQAAGQLKLIQLVSAGYDRMPMDLCRARGIPVANNGGTNSIDVAEHTLMLMLTAYRRLPEMDRNVRSGGWRTIDSGMTTYTLHGKSVGIIGLGNIGQRVAQLLAPFGARLLFYDAFPPSLAVQQALQVTRLDLDDLLQQSDIVTLHVPLLPATHHLIGIRELSLMKSTALLVNTCRGPVVDEMALTTALQTHTIAGAALDVLELEPPAPDHPILQLENVLFTPHTAGVTYDTWARRGEFIFENLRRVWNGQPALALVG